MGECLDQQAKLSPSLREEKSHAGALYAKKSTSKKLEAVRFQKSKKPDQQPQEGE